MSESQTIIAAANTPAVVMDAKGRKIEVLKVDGSRLSRFIRAAGQSASNDVWLGNTMARAAVRSIDGTPIPVCATLDQLDGLWDLVDSAAADAAAKHISDMDKAETPAAIKNE